MINVPNHLKYTLSALQLLAVAKVSQLKHNKSFELLNDFIHSMNNLNSDGLELTINNEKKKYHGYLAFAIGDTPALNWLGGFKEGVAKAEKFCRNCEIKNGEIFFKESEVDLRLNSVHKRRLIKLKNSDKKDEAKLSIEFGINNEGLLNTIDNFNICKCLVQDPMHILHEGICHIELRLFLEYAIETKKIFTLDYLNNKINNFKYAKQDKLDKPNLIETNNFKTGAFTQTSAQMSTLFHCLPLIIGESFKSDDNHYLNFLRLVNIINLVLAFIYDNKTISDLTNLIEIYLKTFKQLYPTTSFTPKMHYLIHFPNQIKSFGAGRFQSAFRFEGKNGQLKFFNFRNFKNIVKSVSYRQEYWMVSKRYDLDWEMADNFLNKGDCVKLINNESDVDFFLYYEIPENDRVIDLCSYVKLSGFEYEIDTFIIINYNIKKNIECIGKIKKIIIYKNEFIFKISVCNINSFKKNLNCLSVIETNKIVYKYYKNLPHKQALFDYSLDNNEYLIQLRYFYHVVDDV